MVFFSLPFMLFTIMFWMWVGYALESLTKWIWPDPPPYCDIGPLCHPGFIWREDGTGWIGSIQVIKK